MVLPGCSGTALASTPTPGTAAACPARQKTGTASRCSGGTPRSASRCLRLRRPRLPGSVRPSSRRQGRTLHAPGRTASAPEAVQEEKLTTLTYGSLEIQPERYSVKLAGQSVACTPREVELLYLLASHPGRVFDREQILSRIWGYDFFGDTRTVDTHIKRLRQKLACEEMGRAWDIITVYGVGYKFEAMA